MKTLFEAIKNPNQDYGGNRMMVIYFCNNEVCHAIESKSFDALYKHHQFIVKQLFPEVTDFIVDFLN